MTIRNAIKEDLTVILEIMNHAIKTSTATYDYDLRTLQMKEDWFAKKTSDNLPVIVVETHGEVVGYGTYGVFRTRDGYKYSVEHSIYISEKHRGQGYGKKLLEELISLATKNGFHTMIAGIDSQNPHSVRLHKKFGFKEVGYLKEVGYKFNTWLDVIFMQLMLKE